MFRAHVSKGVFVATDLEKSKSYPVSGPRVAVPPLPQRLGQFGLIFALSAIGLWVIWDFLPALAWAVVVAIAIWPMFKQLRLRDRSKTGAAAVVTLLVGAIL